MNVAKNTVCWIDIPVLNLERAIACYAAILDARIEKQKMGDGSDFGLLPHIQNNVSGCLVMRRAQICEFDPAKAAPRCSARSRI